MRKALSGIALAVLSFVFLVVTAGSSHAATVDPQATDKAKVGIVRVHYNSKGGDLASNAWQEGVLVRNNSGVSLNLNGWRVHDTYRSSVNSSDWDDKFTNSCVFPSVDLAPNQTVYVTSSSVAYAAYAQRISANHYIYCDFAGKGKGHNGGIYNNMGDTVYLEYRDATESNKVVRTSAKSYGFENGYYVN
jgi:hypothetical protein